MMTSDRVLDAKASCSEAARGLVARPRARGAQERALWSSAPSYRARSSSRWARSAKISNCRSARDLDRT